MARMNDRVGLPCISAYKMGGARPTWILGGRPLNNGHIAIGSFINWIFRVGSDERDPYSQALRKGVRLLLSYYLIVPMGA